MNVVIACENTTTIPGALSIPDGIRSALAIDGHDATLATYDQIKAALPAAGYLLPAALMIVETPGKHDGAMFLRRYWAELLSKGNIEEFPPVIYVCADNIQKLIGQDLRYYALCAEGVSVVPCLDLPGIKASVAEAVNKIPKVVVRQYLKKSCELQLEGLLAHAQRNFMAQYMLLLGGNSAGDVSKEDFNNVVGKLSDSKAQEEIGLFFSMTGKSSGRKEDHVGGRLQDLLKDRKLRILLIDDECLPYKDKEYCGWTDVVKKVFGAGVTVETVGGKWAKSENILVWDEAQKKYIFKDDKLKDALIIPSGEYLINYDLILLDLYLADDDEAKKRMGGDQQPEKYSGLQLLDAIREIDSTVPVILFTASNKAFNMQAAKEIGIQGYFQKEFSYRTENEAKNYYIGFKNLILNGLDWKKKAVRDLFRGLESYKDVSRSALPKSKVSPPDVEIAGLLKTALSSLSMYLENGEKAQLTATCILAGNILEILAKKGYRFNGSAFSLYDQQKRSAQGFTMVTCFLAKSIRNAVAHSSAAIRFEDGYLVLLVILETLDAVVTVPDDDVFVEFPKVNKDKNLIPFPEADYFVAEAELMVNAFCKQACTCTAGATKKMCSVVLTRGR